MEGQTWTLPTKTHCPPSLLAIFFGTPWQMPGSAKYRVASQMVQLPVGPVAVEDVFVEVYV